MSQRYRRNGTKRRHSGCRDTFICVLVVVWQLSTACRPFGMVSTLDITSFSFLCPCLRFANGWVKRRYLPGSRPRTGVCMIFFVNWSRLSLSNTWYLPLFFYPLSGPGTTGRPSTSLATLGALLLTPFCRKCLRRQRPKKQRQLKIRLCGSYNYTNCLHNEEFSVVTEKVEVSCPSVLAEN